jgi:LysM repeat protein
MSTAKTYTVKKGDTLTSIAKQHGKTVHQLVEYNGLTHPDVLHIGQVLKVELGSADLSLQTLFLDAFRQPIEGLEYLLKFDGKEVKAKTPANGLGAAVQTLSPSSIVEVMVKRGDRTWKKLVETTSDVGYKLITLVSPNIALQEPSQKLPAEKPPAQPAYNRKTPPPSAPKGTPIQPGHPVQKKKGKDPNTVVLEVDIPQDLLGYFKLYKDTPITDNDWETESDALDCESEVLKAIAKVESGGRTAFWRLNRDDGLHIPKILFERHYFSRLTKHKYDATHPDISWPVGYLNKKMLGKDNAQVHAALNHKKQKNYTHDNRVDLDDVYHSSASSYLRLMNAYRLDKQAALKSASWGKFQIMGANYNACGAEFIEDFVGTMCSGDLGQIQLLSGFIEKNKPLHEAVKKKDWAQIAFHYNGPSYKTYQYDSKMQQAYNEIKKKSA